MSNGQVTRTNTMIILYVNTRPTDRNGNPIPLTNENIDQYVFMTDTSGDIQHNTGDGIDQYSSKVKSGGTVTWVGAVSDHVTAPRDYVIITDVRPNQNDFTTPPVRLPNPGYGDYVQATIKPNPTEPFEYTIYFNVWNVNAGETPTPISLQIDPQLRIH